ncbi:MAG: hypothetical protein GY711_13145 [bacterium]|nr:hypothetical protein [bacterium]
MPILALALTLTAAPLHPGQDRGVPDPTAAPLTTGRAALEAGDTARALEHFLHALAFRPASREILAELLRVSERDPDARALWSHAWYAAAADASGRAKPEGPARALLAPDDPHPARIAAARAAAFAELVSFAAERDKRAKRNPEELVVGAWARGIAVDLATGAEALQLDASQGVRTPRGLPSAVIKAVTRAMNSAIASRDAGFAVRAARILNGLGAQAGFEDLLGDAPAGSARLRQTAAEGLARARAQLAEKMDEPWTVEQLEWLGTEEGEAFTREHASFALPGIALSPRGWYRVETDCGYETLLGVARTVEDHHARLAAWYGEDPFDERIGTVVVVPGAGGLESEGTPYWWAGGFQSGDRTTIGFACGTIEGLGHTLTHELTHRFDGALYPGMPAWLAEGRAVWTGAAYGHSSERAFVPNHASFGTIESAFIKGYGGHDKLEELIDGSLEDYRDNYTAGYALYVYLATWEEGGSALFAEQLERYMQGAEQGAKKPLRFFEDHFCDGKEGRPEDLDGFAEGFATFVSGFYWQDRKPFTERYTREVPSAGEPVYVYDEPTWVWDRARAEPSFGQGQALLAGELLREAGKKQDALRAYVWALAEDGRTPGTERALEALCRELSRDDAAWALAQLTGFPGATPAAPAPFLRALPKTRALAEALDEALADYAERSLGFARAALAADRARLGRWTGSSGAVASPGDPPATAALHPFDTAPRALGADGWGEERLVDYEERRHEHLWYADASGDVHVGREKPRSGTGKVDPRARQRDAFVLSERWEPAGSYRLRARIQFTTSFVDGAVILGWTRRDRQVRFVFSAGDFLYSIGQSEEEPKFESVGWHFNGLRIRDGGLAGARRGGRHEFGRERTAFDLELVVDGASVRAFVDGQLLGDYHTADGAPIEGRIGFATSMGAVRVQAPTLQRLDRSRLAGRGALSPGLDLAHEPQLGFSELENRSLSGLARTSQGTLLLWIPVPTEEEGEPFEAQDVLRRATKAIERMTTTVSRYGATQRMVVAVPARLGDEKVAGLRAELDDELQTRLEIVTHHGTGSEASPDRGKRWLLFVDSAGVIRIATPFFAQERGFDDRMQHWLTVFKDHGRPERELPRPERDADEGEDD